MISRREVLIGMVGAALGLAAGTEGQKLLSAGALKNPNFIDRVMLDYYKPEYALLVEYFPNIVNYEQGLDWLRSKGLVQGDFFYSPQLAENAKTDPIYDFAGWRHTESEMMMYLTSYYYVAD